MYEQHYMDTSYRGRRIVISTILSFSSRPMFQWGTRCVLGKQPCYTFHTSLPVALTLMRDSIDRYLREHNPHG